ncbi:MAG: hypothetical protein IJW45_04000 [Oscillospiraceae bacterium]|nr:hypothetical protein [Oscillospiraceae bacterium]
MARKAKKRSHKMPPLSVVDRLIYWTILLILFGAYLAMFLLPLLLREQVAFADPMVVAKEDHVSVVWSFVSLIVFFIVTFGIWVSVYQQRRPIFGKKGFRYGAPGWPKIYPLFMKDKPPVWVSENKKKERKIVASLIAAVLLISLIPLPWGIYGRDVLRSDGGIGRYDMFDVQVKGYASEQIDSVEFQVYRHRARKSIHVYWDVQVILTTDSDARFVFEYKDFRGGGGSTYWLEAMLQLKSRYDPRIITYTGAEDLWRVAEDDDLSDEQTRMLYQLFDLDPTGMSPGS